MDKEYQEKTQIPQPDQKQTPVETQSRWNISSQSRAVPGRQPRAAVPTCVLSPYEFLARFLIQIGVPTKPKASRI